MHDLTYLEAQSVKEAIALKREHGSDCVFIAGGTNEIYLMKRGVRKPKFLINIKSIRGLNDLRSDQGELIIGSMVRISELENSKEVIRNYPMLSHCAGKIASPQIRNVATVGGNLSQEVWCWYLTEGFDCWMNGGTHCFAPGGDNRYHHSVDGGYICLAIHPSDLATAFLALDVQIDVAGEEGERRIGIGELLPGFSKVEGRLKQNALKSDEIITQVHVPASAAGSRGLFLKNAMRESFDFAISSIALSMTLEGNFCKDVKIAIGGVSTRPFRAARSESVLRGNELAEQLFEKASDVAFDREIPLSMNSYRIRLTKELLRQGLLELYSLR